jgi:thioesterase domain-containing protein
MVSKESFQQFLASAFPLVGKLGITIEKLTPEEVETRLPEDRFNNNHLNTVYAGVQFTILEVTGGIIFSAAFDISRYFIVVKEMTIEYHRPARGELFARCSFPANDREKLMKDLESTGKASFILLIELRDKSGQVVSIARGTYFVSPQRKS